jgi:hypothetical protein
MAKPLRSPVLGYNHNLAHLGRVFHVQTEDSGPSSPRIFTHLFFEGTILVSRRQEYDPTLPTDDVRALMKAQQKSVIKDLMQARLNERVVAFFAARGEDVVPVHGAVPEAPLMGTPGPVMVLPHGPEPAAEIEIVFAAAPETVVEEVVQEALSPVVAEVAAAAISESIRTAPAPPPRSAHRRTATRSIDTSRGASGSGPIVVRAADGRHPPFVRSGAPAIAKGSSSDGVVMQRNVIVGGGAPSSARPARIRPPVPYVVTGGGHTERLPQPSATAPVAPSPSAPVVAAPPPVAAAEPPRQTGGFGVGLADDKSLDEVILEYLEDGDG